MTKDEDLLVSKLKPYHIILFSCLLCSVLILNSNHVNEQRAQIKLSKEKTQAYEEMMALRRLEGESNSDKICKKGSDDLVKYYQTGDLKLIDLEEGAIKCEDKDTSYMKALRGLARNLLGDGDSSSEDGDGDGDRLRYLDEGDSTKDNLMQYLNRILPMAVFLAIGILSIFGWIGCCIFNCCDCCCCCCCKKRKCKIPCFIFSYVYYALVVAISIYGLAESNKIFEGIANTECSLLKFLEQVVDGEIKQSLPRWAGIDGINNILGGLSRELTEMGTTDNINGGLTGLISIKNDQKSAFEASIQAKGNYFLSSTDPGYTSHTSSYSGIYILDNPNKPVNGYYVLDIVKDFGKYESNNEFTPGSTLYSWHTEYNQMANNAETYIGTAKGSFSRILTASSLSDITSALEEAEGILKDIKGPFDDVNNEIGGTLSDNYDQIDKYGKLVVKVVFSVLMVMNIALAVLMTFIGLFSMKACVDCCFCRCIFKSCVHILWNVLALMMILSFIVGSILALVGRIGGDFMSLASYIFSEDNFNDANPLFLNEMGADGQRYLRKCLIGNGNLAEELDISMEAHIRDLDDLTSVEGDISNSLNRFTTIKNSCPTYKNAKRIAEKMGDMSINFYLKSASSSTPDLSFDEIITTFNNKLESKYGAVRDEYSRTGTGTTDNCPSSAGQGKLDMKITACDLDTLYGSTTDNNIGNYAKIITETIGLVVHTKGSSSDSYIKVLNDLYSDYYAYLESYENILKFLRNQIRRITGFISDYISEGASFSFLNGHFIQVNLKILLKYLKHSLGKDLYTVGICLVVVGFSLILSISSTILLIVIINIGIKEDMEMKNVHPTQSPGGIVLSEYQMNFPNMKSMPQY